MHKTWPDTQINSIVYRTVHSSISIIYIYIYIQEKADISKTDLQNLATHAKAIRDELSL